jgi:ABC-2 type transport system permease protein
VTLLAYALVALALGFLVGQLSSSEVVTNAVGNIVGLAFSFLGGIWTPIEVMTDTMLRIAHFVPAYYFGEALRTLGEMQTITQANLSVVFVDLAILALFALALFLVALVIGRLRVRSASAPVSA